MTFVFKTSKSEYRLENNRTMRLEEGEVDPTTISDYTVFVPVQTAEALGFLLRGNPYIGLKYDSNLYITYKGRRQEIAFDEKPIVGWVPIEVWRKNKDNEANWYIGKPVTDIEEDS